MSHHPTAVISPKASIGNDVKIGPYAIIEDDVSIGDRCQIDAAAQLRNGSKIGTDCLIGSGSILSADPHFRGFDASIRSGVLVGDNNVIREYVTLHRSILEGENTELGDDNFLMCGTHFGHDCKVGSHNTFANNVLLGGHVIMGDHAFLGGGSAFHQFVRLGDYVMVQGHAGFSQDIPPYLIGSGSEINRVAGINSVGLKRAGFSPADRREIKEAFRRIYRSSTPLPDVLAEAAETELSGPVQAFYDFFGKKSKKGVCIRSI